MAQVSDYTALITSEHADKPKFRAMVEAVAQCFVDLENYYVSLPSAFDLDVAIGAQLDAVGLWVGISRKVSAPITGVYFSLDVAGVGFDQGNWKGPFDPDSGLVSLDDDTYRLLVRAKIAENKWDGSLAGLKQILDGVFYDSSRVTVVDNNDMTMDVILRITGQIPSALLISIFEAGYVPAKPEGVLANYTVAYSPLFGFDLNNSLISGFDTAVWAV